MRNLVVVFCLFVLPTVLQAEEFGTATGTEGGVSLAVKLPLETEPGKPIMAEVVLSNEADDEICVLVRPGQSAESRDVAIQFSAVNLGGKEVKLTAYGKYVRSAEGSIRSRKIQKGQSFTFDSNVARILDVSMEGYYRVQVAVVYWRGDNQKAIKAKPIEIKVKEAPLPAQPIAK
ncbi:MAG TPA: hypothetical protein VGP72_23685 [Planctomycetota bacterium]